MQENTAWVVILVSLFVCVVVLFLGWHIVDMVAMDHFSPETRTWDSTMTYKLTLPESWYCTITAPLAGGQNWVVKCQEPR